MKSNIAKNRKTDPLNGLPDIHANTLAENSGNVLNIASCRLEGFQPHSSNRIRHQKRRCHINEMRV